MEPEEKITLGETNLKLRIYRLKFGSSPAQIRLYVFSIVSNDQSHLNEVSAHFVTALAYSIDYMRKIHGVRRDYGVDIGDIVLDGYHEVPIPFSREVRGSHEESVECQMGCYKKYTSILISMLQPDVPGFLMVDYFESNELWGKCRLIGAMLRRFTQPNFSVLTFATAPLKGVSSNLEEMSKAVLTRFLHPPPELESWEYVSKVGKYAWLGKFSNPIFYLFFFMLVYIPLDLIRVFRIMAALKSEPPDYPSLLDRHSFLREVVKDKCVFLWKGIHSNVVPIKSSDKKRNHDDADLLFSQWQ